MTIEGLNQQKDVMMITSKDCSAERGSMNWRRRKVNRDTGSEAADNSDRRGQRQTEYHTERG
jgi:hypothetical protein